MLSTQRERPAAHATGHLSSNLGSQQQRGQLRQSLSSRSHGRRCPGAAEQRGRRRGEPLGVARMSSGGQQRWEASPGEPADKAARGRTCRSLQIQHTPKLRPAPAHKSFCKLLCPTSRCASTPSYTPRPSQASRRTRPPPSWLTWRIVPDTSAWCETAPACQHPGLSSREAAKPYHSFPSPSQAIITQSGLLEEGASLQPGSKVTREQARPNETSSRVSPRQKK